MSSKQKRKAPEPSATQPGSHSKASVDKKHVDVPVASPKKDYPVVADGKEEKKGERDWAAGFKEGDVNKFIALVYKYRLLILIDPRRDLIFMVAQPGAAQAEGKNNNKRRKAKRNWDPNKKFVNCCYVKDKENGWQMTAVWPLSNVMTASLGFGNWAGDPKNKGKDYLKQNIKDAEKTICLDASPFYHLKDDGTEDYDRPMVELDSTHRNKHFMDACAKDRQMAEQLALFMLTERPDLNQKYVDAAYADTANKQAAALKMKYDAMVGVWEGQVEEKKMTIDEFKLNKAKARKQLVIGDDDEVDMVGVRQKLQVEDVLKHFMDEYYTPQVKKRASDGKEYITFQTKVTRSATEDEIKKGPFFANELCKVIYDESGKSGSPKDRKLVYNQHKWDFMSQWGKTEAKVGDEKQRQADMQDDFNRNLDPCSKCALVYQLKIFTQSPQTTFGFHRQFTDIILLRGPTKEEVARIKASQGSRVNEADKMQVPGAAPHQLTELSTKVG